MVRADSRFGGSGQIVHFTCRSTFASAPLLHIDISLRRTPEDNVSPGPPDRYHAGHVRNATPVAGGAGAMTMEQR
jgi:hypothetical protein